MNDREKYINREISWLSFNERVLQEAMDKRVPLYQRIRFLGIFSNNLDEFFRVRVASVRRMVRFEQKSNILIGYENPQAVMEQIQTIVLRQQRRFEQIYRLLINELRKYDVHVIDEQQLDEEQKKYIKEYYQEKIKPFLVPVMLQHTKKFPSLRDKTIYFLVKLTSKSDSANVTYSLLDLTTDLLPRFVQLPTKENKKYIIILDDAIRYCLKDIFNIFDVDNIEAYTIKVTRDAELDFDDDISKSFMEIMEESLEKRKKGDTVRFVYDSNMPKDLFQFISKKMKFHKRDSLIPGGRYHNFKDFINFPKAPVPELEYITTRQIPCPAFEKSKSILSVIEKEDVLLHYPYQSFNYVIDMFREAAIDPQVESIKITLYRVASRSRIINSLINAARNGKKVTVVMEIQARFDEEANIYWSNKLQKEGIRVIHGIQGLKVHSKIALITKQVEGLKIKYAYIGTGNFQENTARIYCDDALITSHLGITSEVSQLFRFFKRNYIRFRFDHLLMSPFDTRDHFSKLIKKEIESTQKGKKAKIIIKLNSLVDKEMIDLLYRAAQQGVEVSLIIRGICSLRTGIQGLSESIKAISIVDKYLEHSRVLYFYADGKEKVYLSSADWMVRNLDNRVEVSCPIYEERLKKELIDMLNMQLKDNTKARILDKDQYNRHVVNDLPRVRCQEAYYEYLKEKYLEKTTN